MAPLEKSHEIRASESPAVPLSETANAARKNPLPSNDVKKTDGDGTFLLLLLGQHCDCVVSISMH